MRDIGLFCQILNCIKSQLFQYIKQIYGAVPVTAALSVFSFLALAELDIIFQKRKRRTNPNIRFAKVDLRK